MNIYVDFDDCLCETAKSFTVIAAELFGKNVPYEEIRYFNLQRSFELTNAEYERLMVKAHEREVLLSYEETPGASKVINGWLDLGYEVSIITGRPYSAFEPSRDWLDAHDLKRVKLYCLDKYKRDSFYKENENCLRLEDYRRMKFDYAVEDSPEAFGFFDHLPDLKVMVFDRPWNRDLAFPNENYTRCPDWDTVESIVKNQR